MMQYAEYIDIPVQIIRTKHSVRQKKHSSAKARTDADSLIQVLNKWMADESGYDEETFPELKARLNQERDILTARRVFDE